MAKKEKKNKDDLDNVKDSGKLGSVIVVALIVIIWVAIFVLIVKLDLFGFGSNVLRPILKDVPVINNILPAASDEETASESDYPYKTLQQAIDRIKELEKESAAKDSTNKDLQTQIDDLQSEVDRLKVFEDNQNAFQELKDSYYNEVVYGDKALTINEYKQWYESIEPDKAEEIYRQVASEYAADEEIKKLAKAYESMKPAEAAAILENMSSDMDTVCDILRNVSDQKRGEILGAMDASFAATVTNQLMP